MRIRKTIAKSLGFMLIFIILFGCFFALPASALVTKGDLGTGVSWSFDFDTKTLHLTGEGEIPFFDNNSDIPWWDYRQRIKNIDIDEGITKVASLKKLTALKTISFPSTTTDIGGSAFYCCTSLETVNLPKNINFIEYNAFYGCCSLKNITIEGDPNGHGNEFRGNGGNKVIRGSGRGYFVRDGVLFSNYDKYFTTSLISTKLNHNRLELYPAGREAETYVIPSDTFWIMSGAFVAPSQLKTVIIPTSVQDISNIAFRGLGENYEHGLNIKFQHNNYLNTIIPSAFHSLPEGSKIIVKNKEMANKFKENYNNIIYYFNGKEKEVDIVVEPISTTALQLNQSNITLKINSETVVEATQTPLTTTDNIVFTSSNENIARFDEYGFGRLAATGVGSAVITVTSGGVSAQCNITVTCDHETSYIANQKDATCTKNGYTGDVTCDACKTVLKTGEVILAKGHRYVCEESKPATCTEFGFAGAKKCSTCGHLVPKKRLYPTGHNYSEWTIITEPTCTNNGYKTRTCLNCGDVVKQLIPKLTHNYSNEFITPPTCSTTGLKQNCCSVCGENVKKIIPKLDHNYTSEITKQPTCAEKGVKTYTCLDCGDSYTKPIAKLSHTLTTTSKPATYFAKGFNGRQTCVVCGAIVNKGSTLKKLKLSKPVISLKSGKKQINIKCKNLSPSTKIQVRYKIKGYWKYRVFKENKSVTKYIKNLKKGKYKVQVRAILKKSKNKVYSAWSKMKKVMVN